MRQRRRHRRPRAPARRRRQYGRIVGCDLVYATDGHAQSARNLSQVSLERDNVFGDGWTNELGVVSGTASSGLNVALKVPVR